MAGAEDLAMLELLRIPGDVFAPLAVKSSIHPVAIVISP